MSLMPYNPVFDGFSFQECGTSKNDQMFDLLKRLIVDGRLAHGTRLPPTRVAAEALGVSRQTVVVVYERLQAEGIVDAHIGKGCFVSFQLGAKERTPLKTMDGVSKLYEIPTVSSRTRNMFPSDSGGKKQARLPFTPGIPDLSVFPTGVIKRLYNKFWSRSAAKDLVYDHSVGSPKLRAAISQFLNNYRGLPCSDDQIVITNGTQSSLLTAACVLADPGDAAIIENPGHLVLQNALRMAGLRLAPWDVDREGIKPDGRVNGPTDTKLLYCAPTNHFPLGVTMSLSRRRELLDWAHRKGVCIFEDDYDHEFCFAGVQKPSLFELDDGAGHVVYSGTLSKFLAPGLRIGYLVIPTYLISAFRKAREALDRHVSVPTQHVCSEFISKGHLSSHLMKVKPVYRQRRNALIEALADHRIDEFQVIGNEYGLNLSLVMPGPDWEEAAVETAAILSLGCKPLSAFANPNLDVRYWGLTFGFADVSKDSIAPLVRKLICGIEQRMQGRVVDKLPVARSIAS